MNPLILYDNRFLDNTPAATDTASGFDILNIRDWRPYTFWKAASAGTKYITVQSDVVGGGYVDALGIIGHNLASASAVVSVESSDDNSSWTERLAGFTPANDFAFLKQMTPVDAAYWRIKIVTASIAPQIGVALLGEVLQFLMPADTPYGPGAERINAEVTRNKDSQILGVATYNPSVEISARFISPTRAWVDAYFYPFWRDHARLLRPFFYAWDLAVYPAGVEFVTVSPDMVYATPLSILLYVDYLDVQMVGVREI